MKNPIVNQDPGDETDAIEAPADLWSEGGDVLWLRGDLAENASKARYIAWTGKDLPTGFNEGLAGLIDLRVRVVYVRPGEPDESGWAGRGAETWWRCDKTHPKAERYWEIRCD